MVEINYQKIRQNHEKNCNMELLIAFVVQNIMKNCYYEYFSGIRIA